MRTAAVAFVYKNSSFLLLLTGIAVFAGSVAYVVNTLFIHPSAYVDFTIFSQFDFYRIAGLLAVVIAIGLLSMAVESYKWWYMSSTIQQVTYFTSVKSVLFGFAIGFITPNRIGDFPGRAIPFREENRGKIILMNLISGYAQFIVICLFAMVAILILPVDFNLYFNHYELLKPIYILVFALLLIFHLWFYFRPDLLIYYARKIKWINKITHHVRGFNRLSYKQSVEVLHFSLLRSVLFSSQLLFILYFFKSDVSILQLFLHANIYFFILTIAPSFVLNKIGIRESISVIVFSNIIDNPVIVVVSVLLLWIINQVIPACIGATLLVWGKK